MSNPYFRFKQFTIYHDRCAMKVTTDACLFGAWVAQCISNSEQQTGNAEAAGSQGNLLDIGAGTGLLSLLVAQKTAAIIEAIEINAQAAKQAQENIAASLWSDRITVIHQNVLLWHAAKQYDCIFSNPPFYQNELRSAKAENNIAHHDEGLQLPDLLRVIQNRLTENGAFFLLLPAKREQELSTFLQNAGLFLQQKVVVQQTLKHPPFRVMIQGRRKEVEQVKNVFIAIKDEADNYTPAFVSLLKEYYLYL
jgi:tRNA1Val (adenine37-N6)-methyltransferase